MFTYTDAAAALIQSLISSTGESSASGLRLSIDPAWGSLRMDLVPGPDTDDQIFRRHDTNVFVTGAAADHLETQVLDARIEEQRTAFFLMDREDGLRR
jgi:Fe-S cluster assembly iron-binding protein IscA